MYVLLVYVVNVCLFRTLSVSVLSLLPVLLLVNLVMVLVWIIVRLVDGIVINVVLWPNFVGYYKSQPTGGGVIHWC